MKIKKNGKVINLTESDLQRIVKRVLSEGNDDPTQRHRYRDGSNPGIEDFFGNPTDRTTQDRLKQQLNDDIYSNVDNPTNIGKGTRKMVIMFNGRKMTIEQFVDQVQRDGEDGYCYDIDEYNYNNRSLRSTLITIKTEDGECKKKVTDNPVQKDTPIKEKRNECSKEWRDNVIDIGNAFTGPRLGPGLDWNKLIPKMGSSKESICNCFRKMGDRRLDRDCERNTAGNYKYKH
jgi:hypothetical protein